MHYARWLGIRLTCQNSLRRGVSSPSRISGVSGGTRFGPVAGLALLAALVWHDAAIYGQSSAAGVPDQVDFRRDIEPIFANRCHSCHGAEKQRSGLRLDRREAALRGGNSGPVIVPGDPDKSRLWRVVAGLDAEVKMPPKGERLTSQQVALLRRWIAQGAPWPETATAVSRPATTHWAFIPARRPTPPAVRDPAWVRNDIDRFVLARLEKEGLAPAPEADRITLLRRVYLDLLGLPPSPQEVDQFLQDRQPDAYERLVDRLLASPHYGERWARHWLDLARYADSDGYEKDLGRPWAWRYRTWVIDALNRDLPFDQFTIEQLAGDLLPQATTEQKVATGFHRNTLTNREGGVDQEQFRVEAVVDRVATTGQVWLGLTLGCARCHEHKYDPISQQEFYQLFAFFNSDQEVDIPAPLPGEVPEFEKKKAEFDKRHAELQAAVDRYRREELPKALAAWEAQLKVAELRKLPETIRVILLQEPERRTEAHKKELTDFFAKQDTKLKQLEKAVADHARRQPQLTHAQTLALATPRKTHVLIRGDFLRPGIEVQPGTPAVLHPFRPADPAKPTRLDLAKWLVDPANPLTPRVTVNWIWSKYFGRGLVATVEDFGTRGEKPSHPELLDWLATELIRRNWSLKAMHRLIVTSATYRQSSAYRPDLAARDPMNTLLARQVRLRLEAEILRDCALTASGLIQHRIGGPSVRPPQPAGIAELTYAGSAKWIESQGPDRYRRGMYTWFQRTSPYPMLMTFDMPDSNLCCVKRERSNTPLQALTLLNDVVFVECAQALAKRMVSDQPHAAAADRIRYGFRLCLAREPDEFERKTLLALFEQTLAAARQKPDLVAQLAQGCKLEHMPPADMAAYVVVARTLLNLDEFMTRE